MFPANSQFPGQAADPRLALLYTRVSARARPAAQMSRFHVLLWEGLDTGIKAS